MDENISNGKILRYALIVYPKSRARLASIMLSAAGQGVAEVDLYSATSEQAVQALRSLPEYREAMDSTVKALRGRVLNITVSLGLFWTRTHSARGGSCSLSGARPRGFPRLPACPNPRDRGEAHGRVGWEAL